MEKIKWYCLRWRVEIYFKVIKSGFHVERCRLETADRLIRYLAVVSIVAWRVFLADPGVEIVARRASFRISE